MRSGEFCTLAALGTLSYTDLIRRLRGHLRGLPKTENVQHMAGIFRRLLREGYVEIPETFKDDDAALLATCHSKGWIQSDLLPSQNMDNTPDTIRFSFPSPLHRSFISWFIDPITVELAADYTLYKLAVETIRNFQPSQLGDLPRRVQGQLDDRATEAQYQNELYRGLMEKFHGTVRITPEFASATAARCAGRIDFFIPKKKWGIECMREGIRLQEHASRFDVDGAYGQWIGSGEMNDYIILDFRSTDPTLPHSGMIALRSIE